MMKRILGLVIALLIFTYGFYSSYQDIGYFYADMQSGADHVLSRVIVILCCF